LPSLNVYIFTETSILQWKSTVRNAWGQYKRVSTWGICFRTSQPALASTLPEMYLQAVHSCHKVLSSSGYLLYIALACCSLPSQPCSGSAPMSPAPPCSPHQAASSGLIPNLPCLASSCPGTRSRLLDWLWLRW